MIGSGILNPCVENPMVSAAERCKQADSHLTIHRIFAERAYCYLEKIDLTMLILPYLSWNPKASQACHLSSRTVHIGVLRGNTIFMLAY